jgi:aminomethyltransferase
LAYAHEKLQRTSLYDRHVALGARVVPFAGWEMPVQYEGVRQEHLAVRSKAGLFDVSHMGEIETTGPDAEAFLQHVLSNDISKMAPNGAQYSVLCRPDGGVLDDLFTYKLDDRYLTVTNAANHTRDLEWFQSHASGFDVEVDDAHARYAMQARQMLSKYLAGEAPRRMRVTQASVAGVDCLVCGTGYTGEDGVELLLDPGDAVAVWDALCGEGAAPAGLAARDTLRLEACFHLYGNDLDEDHNPIEAGLSFCCKLDTGFIGSDALREIEPDKRLVPFAFTGPGIPRQHNPVRPQAAGRSDDWPGIVTSGTMSPSLGIGVGMAYVPAWAAEPATALEVDVRGRTRLAEVRTKPLYRKED